MINKQPNSLHCFVCGIDNAYGLKLKFYQSGNGEITAQHTVPKEYQGYPGIVHGGIVGAMLDEAAGRSLMGPDPLNPRFMFTARLDIQYRRPVPVGKELRIVGRAIRRKNRSATATSAIYDESEQLLAEANVILVDVPQEMINRVDMEALGWKVYPDLEEK